ncbi:hypothetical protein H8958_020257 [Nasalis larvatus]
MTSPPPTTYQQFSFDIPQITPQILPLLSAGAGSTGRVALRARAGGADALSLSPGSRSPEGGGGKARQQALSRAQLEHSFPPGPVESDLTCRPRGSKEGYVTCGAGCAQIRCARSCRRSKPKGDRRRKWSVSDHQTRMRVNWEKMVRPPHPEHPPPPAHIPSEHLRGGL